MLETFYIEKAPRAEWYYLRLQGSHFCLSSGNSLDDLLDNLYNLVKKYRSRQRLMNRLSEMSYTPDQTVGRAESQHGDEVFDQCIRDYGDMVKDTVKRAQREVQEEDKANAPHKKVLKRIGQAVPDTVARTVPHVLTEVRKETPDVVMTHNVVKRRPLLKC